MKRFWVSLLTIVLYILAQISPYIARAVGWIQTGNQAQLLRQSIAVQFTAFIIVAILIIILQFLVKNKLNFELGPKEKKRYILPYILVGLVIVFIAQMLVNLISVQLFGANPASENTLRIMKIARQTPIFIVLIAIVGPLLESLSLEKYCLVNCITQLKRINGSNSRLQRRSVLQYLLLSIWIFHIS